MVRGFYFLYMNVKFVKIHPNAKTPTQANPGDAGYDLYALEPMVLKPMSRALIKTGLKIEIPNGYYGRIAPRSGLAYKKGIDVLAGVIDCNYRDEVGVILINLNFDLNELLDPRTKIAGSQFDFRIAEGDRIAQIIIENCASVNWEESDKLSEIDRGGGFGSSGR